jgi:hypothetical protein
VNLCVSYESAVGYGPGMPDPLHEVAEEAKKLEHEADEGKSARTPLILIGEVWIFVTIVVAVVLVIAFTAYYLAK